MLLFSELYDSMQENMNKSIFEINRYITSVNASNDMVTPFVANTIIEYRGEKAPRVFFNRFSDGVHPPTEKPRTLINKISKRFFHAINLNRKFDKPNDSYEYITLDSE